jgi:hypothetical protein
MCRRCDTPLCHELLLRRAESAFFSGGFPPATQEAARVSGEILEREAYRKELQIAGYPDCLQSRLTAEIRRGRDS